MLEVLLRNLFEDLDQNMLAHFHSASFYQNHEDYLPNRPKKQHRFIKIQTPRPPPTLHSFPNPFKFEIYKMFLFKTTTIVTNLSLGPLVLTHGLAMTSVTSGYHQLHNCICFLSSVTKNYPSIV